MLRRFKKAHSANVRVGVMQDGSRIELAVVRRLADGTVKVDADNVEDTSDDIDWARDSHSGIGHKDLREARVSTVLDADAYSLQLIEAPNVPDAEIQQAVRWRIQHLIEFPIDDAVVETFEMPAPANPGARPMIYAVVAHHDEIVKAIDRVKNAKLYPDVIDIPELCIRNVATQLPQDADGAAFLHFTDDCGYLTITRRGVLYMIRRIETRRGELADADDDVFSLLERSAGVALEVQRSLDYYESHYDCRPVNELVLGPGHNLDTHANTLAENLGIKVSRLNLDDLFTVGTEIRPDVQSDCLLAIGAALRSNEATRAVAA